MTFFSATLNTVKKVYIATSKKKRKGHNYRLLTTNHQVTRNGHRV
jgi:hypothetical protein